MPGVKGSGEMTAIAGVHLPDGSLARTDGNSCVIYMHVRDAAKDITQLVVAVVRRILFTKHCMHPHNYALPFLIMP